VTAEATQAVTVLEVVPAEDTAVCVNLCGCAECTVLCCVLHRLSCTGQRRTVLASVAALVSDQSRC